MKKQVSTTFLKVVVVVIGLIVLAVCALALPAGITTAEADYYVPLLWGMYVPVVPFFIALYQTIKLLGYIEKNQAFSELSIKALNNITYCGFVISAIFALGLPYIYHVAQKDDAPGVMALGCVIVGASFVIGVAAAVFRKLVQTAVDIKSENDLTV